MARRRSNSSPTIQSPLPRPSIPVAVRIPRPVIVRTLPVRPVVRLDLRLFEDRRRWHPAKPLVPAGVLGSRDARRLTERPRYGKGSVKTDPFPSLRLGFAVPQRVVVCVRRKRRREVLFAVGGTGKGARQQKRRRNIYSEVSC